jgi:hypothetical protein
MAVVGEARIIVKAITDGVGDEISRALKSAQKDVDKDGAQLGRTLNKGFMRGFGKSTKKGGIFGDLFDLTKAEAARKAFATLQRSGLTLQTSLSALTGAIFTLVGGLGSLIGSAGAAAPSILALVSSMVGLKVGMGLAGFALGGVTNAMNSMGGAGGGLKKTVAELREELQQLRFEAEEAALSEKEAALNLEKARENLARVSDLPVNSMARREAELALEQADLAYRKAKDRTADLNKEVAKGPQQNTGGGGADPYAGLTKSQKKFAKFLVGIKPKLDELKEAVASGFLPALEKQIGRVINKTFPIFKAGFEKIGDALGVFSTALADALVEAGETGTLKKVFDSIAKTVEQIGPILADAFGSFLLLLEAAAPLTESFLTWIGDAVADFKAFLEVAKGDGSLEKFLTRSGEIAADFGDIFGDIFKGLGALISDSFAPGSGGDMLLQWLKTAFDGFAEIGSDKAGLRTYLQNTASNLISVLSAIGGLIGQFLAVAADPKLKEFFDILSAGAPSIEKILDAGLEAAPALGELIIALADIAAILGDAAAPKAFFEALRDIAIGVADFLKQKEVKDFLTAIAPIAGQFLAIGFVVGKAKGLFSALLGTVNMFVTPFKSVFDFFQKNKKGVSEYAKTIGKLKDGIAKVKDVFETVAIKGMYFKDAIVKGAGALKTFAINAGKATIALFKQGIQVAKNIGLFILQKAQLVGAAIAQAALKVATVIGTAIQAAFNFVLSLNPITLIVIAVLALIAALVYFFTQTQLGQEIWANFTRFLGEAWGNTVNFFTDTWNNFVGFFQTAVEAIGGFFTDVWTNVTAFFTGFVNGLIGMFEGFINFVIDGLNDFLMPLRNAVGAIADALGIEFVIGVIPHVVIPRLAKGGIVSPSMGGSLVNVAEAGRPERIEPLDENGLSKRDKAMITMLSGGAGGGVNITVNASPGMDATELAAIVSRRISYELRRGVTA